MKAVVFNKYGGNEVLELKELPKPEPGQGDVLIRVHAASVNPVDWKIRYGSAKILTGFSFPRILGSECSGEIIETGRDAKAFMKGDGVIGFPGIRRLSAFAEYVSVSEKNTWPKPENVGFEEASTIPVAGITALQSLRSLGHISASERVLINGASGGVGTFAVQIAKIFGAKVTAVCSDSNAELVKDLGADHIIDYTRQDFTKSGEHYDIVFDTVSKRSFHECKKVLTPKGVYINTLPVASILVRQYLIGFLSRKKARSIMVRPNTSDMEWMKTQIEAGRIKVIIDRVYPLDQIREALAYSESGRAKGKVVLKVFNA